MLGVLLDHFLQGPKRILHSGSKALRTRVYVVLGPSFSPGAKESKEGKSEPLLFGPSQFEFNEFHRHLELRTVGAAIVADMVIPDSQYSYSIIHLKYPAT